MSEFNPRTLEKGTPVLVKTDWGWMDGEFYDYLPHLDQVRVCVNKVRCGKRYLWPPGASNIWPHVGICGMRVEPNRNWIRPTDKRT